MKENYIIVSNESASDVEKVLMDLANLYANTGYTEGISLLQKNNRPDSFLVSFKNQPDFERFNYFVNYIRYPIGYNKNFSPMVRGFFDVNQLNEKADFKDGDWIMVYISKNDKAGDNVHIVNRRNESYEIDFGGKTKRLETLEEPFALIEPNRSDYHLVSDIVPTEPQEAEEKPWWKFW